MKLIKHDYKNTDICIYSNNNNIIRGSFFNNKPVVGTTIKYITNYYKVVEIISNIDAKISKNCKKNPEKALFELRVVPATQSEISEAAKH
jgi:fructose-specific phosphotransferase system component IIB